MPTAGSILSNIRVLFGDPDRDWLSDGIGLDFLDRAQRRFCQRVQPLDEYKDFTITAKANKFDLPADCVIPIWVMWFQSRTLKLEYEPPSFWSRIRESHPNATGTPERYTMIRRQLEVGPQVPQTASATSTASGAIDAADTTLGLTAASGTFRSKGWVKINSEVIEYTGVATTTLTGCTRGVHNTTAATHSSADTVTEIDLQMLYRRTPATLATGASPEIPTMFHDYLEHYALYLAWLARGDEGKASAAYQEFAELEASAIRTVGRRVRDGLPRIQERYDRWRWWILLIFLFPWFAL